MESWKKQGPQEDVNKGGFNRSRDNMGEGV